MRSSTSITRRLTRAGAAVSFGVALAAAPLLASPASAATPGSACTVRIAAPIFVDFTVGGTVTSSGSTCSPVPEVIALGEGSGNPILGQDVSDLLSFVASQVPLTCGTSPSVGLGLITGTATVSCPN